MIQRYRPGPAGGPRGGPKTASSGPGFSYRWCREATGVVRRRPGRKVPGRLHGRAMNRAARRMRRRAERAVLGRIRLGTAGASPRLRRWTLGLVLLGVALLPYPALTAASGTPAAPCRPGCRAGPVPSMIKWTRPLPGSWQVVPGLTGTVPAAGLAYVSVGYGLAAIGAGLTVSGYSDQTGAPLWTQTLTGFPPGAAIVSVRTWPGEVTAGVSYTAAGHPQRTEVVLAGPTGLPSGRYPAAVFGGAVWASAQSTVIIGPTAVTSYDNTTGRVRWRVSTGPVQQAWRTDDGTLYLAESPGGFLASAPATALRLINLATGADSVVRPIQSASFPGTFSVAFDGAVLFSSVRGVTAYSGTTGTWLWTIAGAVAEGTDPRRDRIYLAKGADLIAVNPLTGRVTATASGSAVDGSAGLYTVRDGVALGLDQGPGGDAWGYDLAAQRVILAAAGLPWPHYFVDLSGIGGSADPASNLVVIAACARLGPSTPVSASPPVTPSGSPFSAPAQTATSTPSPEPPVSGTPSPPVTPSAPGQACLQPELVALNL
jgi:hypothetical protein